MNRLVFAVLLAGGAIASFHARAQSADPNLGRNLGAACANCHGTGGHATTGMPALAGLPKEYIAKQMRDFRSGARPATIMHQISKGYTDGQIEAMAAYFAAQKK